MTSAHINVSSVFRKTLLAIQKPQKDILFFGIFFVTSLYHLSVMFLERHFNFYVNEFKSQGNTNRDEYIFIVSKFDIF